MIDLKDEKRDIYDYFDLIDQAKTKKEREGYIDEALLSEPDNLRLLLIKNEKNRKKQAEYLRVWKISFLSAISKCRTVDIFKTTRAISGLYMKQDRI